jgi:hypothetical protein
MDNIMGEVIVCDPMYSVEDSYCVASVSIIVNGKPWELRYKVSMGPIARGSDAFLAATLFPAMKIGQPLRINGAISPRFLSATGTIQDILHKWYPEFQKVAVEADPKIPEVVGHQKDVGAFFSGGVDSFYTLLKHQEEITKIIFVHGFDIWLDDYAFRKRVSRELQEIAVELHKPLIEVETNLREFLDRYIDWGQHSHGSALASVALLLSSQFKKIYIPSTRSYDNLHAWGSHVLLDPLWSTGQLEIKHDGCEASRNEKVASTAQNDTVLKSLRVCYENLHVQDNYEHWGDTYNCGRCEKCLRTMISLHAIGALGRCKSFSRKLEPEAVSDIQIDNDMALHFAEENLRAIERLGNEPTLAQALRNCIGNYKQKTLEKEINEHLKSFENSPWWGTMVSKKKNSSFKAIWEKERGWVIKEVVKESIKLCDDKLFKGKLYSLFRQKNG